MSGDSKEIIIHDDDDDDDRALRKKADALGLEVGTYGDHDVKAPEPVDDLIAEDLTDEEIDAQLDKLADEDLAAQSELSLDDLPTDESDNFPVDISNLTRFQSEDIILDNVSNSRLAFMLKRHIVKHHWTKKTRGLTLCGSRLIGGDNGEVTIFTNGENRTLFTGIACCHSAWACPNCTAKVLALKGANIACLIEARAKWEKKFAFMVTFTLPHTDEMSCKEAYEMLRSAWRMFSRDGNLARNSQGKALGAYGQFRGTLKITNILRVFEFTWGENGWHPHIHALMWAPKESFEHIADWEGKLSARWWHCAKFCYRKGLHEQNDPEADAKAEKLYSEQKYIDCQLNGHKPVFISKDKNGKARIEQSSHYMTGWAADREVTGEAYKSSKFAGHYTPFQILNAAYHAQTPEQQYDLLELFCEYAEATRGTKRFCFTPGDNRLIDQWKETIDFTEMYKKKATELATAVHPVAWLSSKQWSSICEVETTYDVDLRSEILQLALLDNPEVIYGRIEDFGISCARNRLRPPSVTVVNCILAA